MKTKYLFITLLLMGASQSCNKSSDAFHVTLHSGIVLAATCSSEPSSTEVAVQLDNKDRLSFDWTNPKNDSIYHNVVVTFDQVLKQSIGKSLTYSSVRQPTSKDTLANLTPAYCISYPIVYLDNVTVK